jgi:dCTP diphosphatase
MIDEQELQRILRDFANNRDWEQFHSPRNLVSALNVEAGELLELFQWESANHVVDVNDPETRQKIEDEIADVFIYLLRIADKLDVSLEDVAMAKIKKNAEKYPIEKSKGKAVKYTEL